jgi:NAD(P)-dependent dehydrogenase (short-subunit alcohol dehydrogenase family)
LPERKQALKFKGKVALVTGAGSGIGRGIATCLAEEGALVIVNDIRQEAAEESQRILVAAGHRAEIVVSDISTPDGAELAIKDAVRHGSRLDLLVNCAGRQIIKPVEDLSPEDWDTVLDTNLKGAYLCTKAAIPFLAEQHGAVVNISSVHARGTIEGFSAYAASKGGILALTRARAIECAPRGVRINAVSPGTIDAPLLQAFFDSCPNPARARQEFLKFHPIGRFGTPRDVGNLVAFLGSEEAGFITGTEVIADGGMTALLFKQ